MPGVHRSGNTPRKAAQTAVQVVGFFKVQRRKGQLLSARPLQIEACGKVLRIRGGKVQAETPVILGVGKQHAVFRSEGGQAMGIWHILAEGKAAGGAFHPKTLGKNTLRACDLPMGKGRYVMHAGQTFRIAVNDETLIFVYMKVQPQARP